MTEYGIYYPAALTGRQLDVFLAKGWYRMGQGIFTTNYVIQEDHFFRVYWLRYRLKDLQMSRQAKTILKLNSRFTTAIRRLEIDTELEYLYRLYKSSLAFEPAESVQSWLFENQLQNIYDSWIVEIRDNGTLIGAGIFDKGQDAVAGILNCYHPAYKKYSIGKYLILLKIQSALSQNKNWYYPGYSVKDYPKFDYKLFVDKASAELYIPETNQWSSYHQNLMTDTSV